MIGERIELTAENIYDLHYPTYCPRRLFYRFYGWEEGPSGPFEQLIFELAQRHEVCHLNSTGEYTDLSSGGLRERAAITIDLIEKGTPFIYQGVLSSTLIVEGRAVQAWGIPDLLVHKGPCWVIRDCKLTRKVSEEKHPEIKAQLQFYGFLFERSIREKPGKLEVFLGDGSMVDFPYDDGRSATESLKEIISTVTAKEAPYSPVNWSKCQGCGFHQLCWEEARARGDVSLLYGVDQNLALALRENGTSTVDQLLANWDESSLSKLSRPWGSSSRKVGKEASRILLQAKAMKDKRNIPLARVKLPESPNFVGFDLEGFPPYLNQIERVYLWGTKVYGENPSPYRPSLSPIEEDGDLKGWKKFLSICEEIFAKYGDIPFIHWAPYETSKIKLYRRRYGDPEGIAERVLGNLVDLLPLARRAIVLAEPSYSLKVVERVAGFKRSQDEYGGDWSMAKYFQAVETQDKSLRKEIFTQILRYNEEDLDATWAVFQWLRGQNEAHRGSKLGCSSSVPPA